MKIIYQLLGHLFLALGIIGIFLPLLPTTPFILLAVYFYSKSSHKLYSYILNHDQLGPMVIDWRTKGIIRPKAKLLAIGMILLVMVWRIPQLNITLTIKIGAEVTLLALIIFIGSRPNK